MATVDAWRAFLRRERCALEIREATRESGTYATIPAHVREILDYHADRQLKRALSARAQLHRIAEIAAEHGWQVIVLKGAADIARGRACSLTDVDILAPVDTARALWQQLAPGLMPKHESPFHFPTIVPESGLSIEIHHNVLGFGDTAFPFDRTVALKGYGPLQMLRPAEHAWVYLNQAVHAHPERAFALRDILLLRAVVKQFDEDETARLHALISSSAFAPYFHAALQRAETLQPVTPGYRKLYLLTARIADLSSHSPRNRLWQSASGIVVGGARHNWKYKASKWRALRGSATGAAVRGIALIAATWLAAIATADSRLLGHDRENV